jgi:hypothetical protein
LALFNLKYNACKKPFVLLLFPLAIYMLAKSKMKILLRLNKKEDEKNNTIGLGFVGDY